MNIYLLTAENLRNNAFIKDFAFYFKPKGKAVLLHAGFGSPADTRFVTKRLSAYLSEEMVVNAILNGDQRNLVARSEGAVSVRGDLLHAGFHQVDLLVMNDLMADGETSTHVGLEPVLAGLKAIYPDAAVTLFPANPRSALGQKEPKVFGAEPARRLLEVFDEEKDLLELAARIAPVSIVNPVFFAPQP